MTTTRRAALFPSFVVLALSVGLSPAGADEGAAAAATYAEVPERQLIEFRPGPEEAGVPERFRVKPQEFAAEATFLRDSGTVRVYQVKFPSLIQGEIPENNTVYGEYFLPPGEGPHPGVVVLHILGGEFPLSQMVANSLAREGVAALFIKMPYYGERRSKTNRRRMISRDPDETLEGMTQAVLDIRRAAAWLRNRPEVDAQRMGVTGISLGGIMSALSAPAEPSFRKVAIYLGGGNLSTLLWDMEHPEVAEFKKKWLADGGTRETFLQKMNVVDPVTYAPLLRERDVLMVNAEHDEIIPRDATIALWEASGKPELVWLDAGHITASRYIFGEVGRLQTFFTRWPVSE